MTSQDKYYVCAHSGCTFQTAKRKAIYTHLIRTHTERKEDFECEYCSAEFQNEVAMESHLQQLHPGQPVTYTCVSRIENVINRCAKLGQERRLAEANGQVYNNDNGGVRSGNDVVKSERRLSDAMIQVKSEQGVVFDSPVENTNNMNAKARTKASVNASLNHIAKHAENNGYVSPEMEQFDDACDNDYPGIDEGDSSKQTAHPPGLKIKFNLKNIARCSTKKPSQKSPTSPPLLEATMGAGAYNVPRSTSPGIPHANTSSSSVEIREPASKYFDKLEVYHTTDALGRRCCPFCPYTTTKNTIRVHLSGIHKVYFVKCSLCDYKAAFPHQITQHGLKFHKTSKLNVIQLSKESREKVISQLPKSPEFEQQLLANQQSHDVTRSEPIIEQDNTNCSFIDDVISSDSSSEEEEENAGGPAAEVSRAVDERAFKPPKCQTSKTDYYNIQVENGVYLYCCNLCDFQTPVRATIYTHKYRHEQKSYRCGYCEYVSFPRSNVVHHMRYKHKDLPILVVDAGEATNKEETKHANDRPSPINVKQESSDDVTTASTITPPSIPDPSRPHSGSSYKTSPSRQSNNTDKPKPQPKTSPTIIKVPEYKRSLTSAAFNQINEKGQSLSPASKKAKASGLLDAGYKLSLNKLYRINPLGSPKFVCVRCPYACDTHPKMKHHLYRHRPQQYKCPYCEHRKYPRSYVVRHVRDTHRGKPLRVIDLSKGAAPIDVTDPIDDSTDDVETQDDSMETGEAVEGEAGMEETYRLMNMYIQQGLVDQADDLSNNNNTDIVAAPVDAAETIVKHEPDDRGEYSAGSNGHSRASHVLDTSDDVTTPPSYKTLADKLQMNLSNDVTSDRMFAEESPDVAPNFSETVYTSTPLIESIINNGQFPADASGSCSAASLKPQPVQPKNPEKKKSTKDYRIAAAGEPGPRYVCNKCGYGTENYKTIHNHMYRHESQRYQCPYCGYRRSPRSFVETHIREVHKGNPVLVTELTEDMDTETPLGSPRQCGSSKRKPPFSSKLSPLGNKRFRVDNACSKLPKLPTKWPAPKPASKVLSVPKVNTASPTQKLSAPVKQNHSTSAVSSAHDDNTQVTSNTSGKIPTEDNSPDESRFISNESRTSPGLGRLGENANGGTLVRPPQLTYKEGSRTTFKTMYKCVFDPETCNHISKDKSKMKQHLFMHVEYKPWVCDRCDMTASQSSHIKNHVRAEHAGLHEMSFSYKKHNYLEKHIDGFLNKGLFTVPVSEYRRIMDMKGNTKSAQKSTFARDGEGHLLCPYCDYKTKSGGMTDHVKMKHMQPRFKCHWCDFSAFYRSEVRKHHRKEKSHSGREFKTQELDLSQMLNQQVPISVDSGGVYWNPDTSNADDDDSYIDEDNSDEADEDDRDDDEEDMERGEMDTEQTDDALAKLMSENPSGFSDMSLANESGFLETFSRTANKVLSACSDELDDTEKLVINIKQEHIEQDDTEVDVSQSHDTSNCSNASVNKDDSVNVKKEAVAISENLSNKGNKFQCGYCSFSATLRVKVKMHCSKKHPNKVLNVVEPTTVKSSGIAGEKRGSMTRVDANDWKGTKFEQDLRKAGVSTLNLTSLFPRSKKCKVGSETEKADMETHIGVSKDGDSDSDMHPHVNSPLKKASVSQRMDAHIANVTHVDKEQEPEFKVPRSPSTIQKVEKSASTKRSVSEADTLIHDRLTSKQEKQLNDHTDATRKHETEIPAAPDNTNTATDGSSPTPNPDLDTDTETCDRAMDIIVEPLDSDKSVDTPEDVVYEAAKEQDINLDLDDKTGTEHAVTDATPRAVVSTALGVPSATEISSPSTHIRSDDGNESTGENGDVDVQATSPDGVVQTMVPSCSPVVLETGSMDDNENSPVHAQENQHSDTDNDTQYVNAQTDNDSDRMDSIEALSDSNLQNNQDMECTTSVSETQHLHVETHQENNSIYDTDDTANPIVLNTEVTDTIVQSHDTDPSNVLNVQECDSETTLGDIQASNLHSEQEVECMDTDSNLLSTNDAHHRLNVLNKEDIDSLNDPSDTMRQYMSDTHDIDSMDTDNNTHQPNVPNKQETDGVCDPDDLHNSNVHIKPDGTSDANDAQYSNLINI